LTGVPITIFTAHGFVFHEFMSKGQYNFYLYMEKLGGLMTDQIIAVSKKDAEKALTNKVISKEKVATIHNGIDVNYFNPNINLPLDKIKNSLGIDKEDLVIGLLGRLVKEKGIPFFIEAAAEVKNKYDNVKFLLVGDGPLRGELEASVHEKGLKEFFIFAGLREDVKEVLAIMDIVVFSSIKEGLPLALLEAMAMERPIVATSVGGIPEVIIPCKNGVLVAPRQSQELSAAIETFLKDKDLAKELGQQGRKTVVEKFSQEKMVKKTENIYRKLLTEQKLIK